MIGIFSPLRAKRTGCHCFSKQYWDIRRKIAATSTRRTSPFRQRYEMRPSPLPLIFHVNRRFLLYNKPIPRHHCSSAPDQNLSPPPAAAAQPQRFQQLHDIVFHEVGSLDDMESRLDSLGVPVTTSLLTNTINSLASTQASTSVLTTRRFLRFFSWSRRHGADPLPDEIFLHAIRVVASRKDLTALGILTSDLKRENRRMDAETFALVSESLVKSEREVDAVCLFKDLEKNPDGASATRVTSIIHALCERGHARKAEGVLWHHKEKLTGAGKEHDVYRHLLHGWCNRRNAGEARRVLGEMKSAGFCPGLGCYNAYLRCVCDRNLRFNPSALVSEANMIMMDMKTCGVSPTAVSYNILLSCLGRTRRVKEACEILESMMQGGAGCSPDWVSYFLVVRVLYLAERFVRGNRIVGQMIESGMRPGARFYHDLIGVLCGVERMDHALQVFEQMKKWCTEDAGPTYDLLISKLCRNGEFNRGRRLWDEAVEKGVALSCSADLLDPSKVEVFNVRNKMDKHKERKGVLGRFPKQKKEKKKKKKKKRTSAA